LKTFQLVHQFSVFPTGLPLLCSSNG
jgi:hypothetical protein